ncbi:MAG: Clp protease ClpP [Gammaproteobacteria bacterium]|nr:Clp protease ClpP [Gammaproteobacteria bacterium]
MKGSIKLQMLARANGQRAAARLAQLLVFGDIGDWGDTSVSAKIVVEQLNGIAADELLVKINSYGGRVDEGIAIYNAIRAFKGTVTTRVEGVAASIASVIAMAGHRVEMAQGSMLMIHAAWQWAEGNSTDLTAIAESLGKADRNLAEIYARKTGRSVEDELARIKTGEDRWYTAEEAVAEGYADAIYDPEATAQAAAEPVIRDGLLHHLPAAGAYASAIRQRLANPAPTPKPGAARAARRTQPKENRMNFTALALALGITLEDGADEAAAKAAVLLHLGLADTATDAEIATAVAEMGSEEASAKSDEEKAAAQARVRARIAARAAKAAPAPSPGISTTPMQARAREVGELFDIAMVGRTDRAQLNTLRAQAVLSDKPISEIRAELTAYLAGAVKPISAAHTQAGEDQRDKFRAQAVTWLQARAGAIKPGSKQAEGLNGNRFRGMNLHDIARDCLEEAGGYRRGMNRKDVIQAAITHTTSDFPNIFENALNKMLLDGFALQAPSWPRFAKVGSLTDFRPHIRYRAGSIGDLEVRQQNGEFKSLTLSDAERETITAVNRGGILNVSYEMIVNDDMSVFTEAARMLGQSAARTLDKAVFALFALNSGNGPTMGDGKALFAAEHNNIAATGARPTVTSIEAARVLMASQLDVSGNDYLDLRPDRFLGPLSTGGEARAVNNSTFDPDATNKLQRFNIVGNLLTDIIDTPRLSGNAWYLLANPNQEPVFEVGFLDGQQEPQFEQEDAFSQHGMKWRVNYPFGVAAIGWRGIVRNPGA